MFKDDFEILPDTILKTLVTAAPAAYAGYQAINANIKYGQEVDKIESLLENRQAITNPYKDIENPYKNLPVATQAARFQAENADIALANTLDTLRATGAAAGGATALAQAALQSQQGISASLEKQEAQNARLRAQGQLQVDVAKAKGESFRMRLQEARDVRDINRIQRQADIFKATEIANKRAVFDQLGAAAEQFTSGIVPAKKDSLDTDTATGTDVTRKDLNVGEFVQNQFGGTNPVSDTILKNSSFDINTLPNTPVDFNAASLGIDKFDINALQQTPIDFNSQLLGIGLDSSAAGVAAAQPATTNAQPGIDPRVDMTALNSPIQVVRMLEKQRLINEGIPVPTGY